MISRLLALALLVSVSTGCSDDAPTVDSTTTITSDADGASALDAERAELQASLDAVEAQNEIDSLRAELDAARDRPTSASATARPGAPAPAATPAPASAAPGLTGLPPSQNASDLFSGSKAFRFCETYQQSAIDRYQGMELCYEGTVRQQGSKLVGSGRKSTEDGTALAGAARTPLQIEGYLYDDYTVRFNYTVKGERRTARGSASFDGNAMNGSGEGSGWSSGTFQTDAANSSGDAFLFISNPVG